MKPLKKFSAIFLTAAMLFSLLWATAALEVGAAAGDDPNPSGAYIKYTVDVNKPEGETLAYNYVNFVYMDYQIQEGDVVEYDVYIGTEERGWGAIDGKANTEWGEMRDSNAVDSDGTGIHTGQDLSEYAFEQWYHRAVLIGENEGLVGSTIEYFQICSHPQNDELEYQAYVLYDNIVITNNGEEKFVVFRDETHWPRAETSLDIVNPSGSDKLANQITLSHQKDCTAKMELLVFTQEEIDAFAAAKAAKEAEEASKEASREASREQASIDQASRDEAARQSEAEAAAAAEAAEAESSDAEETKSGDDEGSNMLLIILIAGGGVLLVVIIIIIAATGKKKKGPEEIKEENKEEDKKDEKDEKDEKDDK